VADSQAPDPYLQRLAHMAGLHLSELTGLAPAAAEKLVLHLNTQNRRIQGLVNGSVRDDLTGTLRRAAGQEAMERELHRARRLGAAGGVVAFVDVDRLKTVNDSAGHAAGDLLLSRIGEAFRARTRAYDIVSRWGGDEFVCMFPSATLAEAQHVVCEVRERFHERTGRSFSFGLAEIRELGEDLSLRTLIALADARLYEGRATRWPAQDGAPA
jgi:diguanylate cyclase (GGDEF)-like protein